MVPIVHFHTLLWSQKLNQRNKETELDVRWGFGRSILSDDQPSPT